MNTTHSEICAIGVTVVDATRIEVFASVFNADLVDYLNRDFVAGLTPLIERDAWNQPDYVDVALETFGGKQSGIPRGGIPSPVFYNKDLFDEAGLPYLPTDWADVSWAWDTILVSAQALTKREGSVPHSTASSLVQRSTGIRGPCFGEHGYSPMTHATVG